MLQYIVLIEISQSQKDKYTVGFTVGFHLCEISKIVKLLKTEQKSYGCQGQRGGGDEQLLINQYKISVMQTNMFKRSVQHCAYS